MTAGGEDSADGLIAGRYQLGQVIGRGGMAEVRHGRDTRLDRDVAVKLLRADLAADPVARGRFEDEARAAAQLGHPHAVTVFDTGEHQGVPYIVMECLPGRTLAEELQHGRLTPDRVRSIGCQMLDALGAAHHMGIVHRDVKPGNILITAEGDAKLSDFGIAKTTEGLDHTMTGQIFGTPAYLAPERLDGYPATPASDLYSLGFVLYEAVSGGPPFTGDSPLAIALATKTQPVPPLSVAVPDLDPNLAAAIERAMEKDPDDRFAHASDMASALGPPHDGFIERSAADAPTVSMSQTQILTSPSWAEESLSDEPPTAEPVSAPAGPIGSRRRALWVVGLLAILAVLSFLLLRSDGDPSDDVTSTTTPATAPVVASVDENTLPPELEESVARLEELVQP